MAKHVTPREKRKARIRRKITGTAERPRLTVYKSLKHMYAQLVDDVAGKTLVSMSTTAKALKGDVGAEGRHHSDRCQFPGERFDRGSCRQVLGAPSVT